MLHFPERYFLVFWPEEDCYNEVPELKVVGELGVVGETINIEERTKVHQGLLVCKGDKQVVQQEAREDWKWQTFS